MPAQWVETREIEVGTLTRFPGNARRGNVAEIRKSIMTNGQYRAIVVQKCDDGQLLILAGNHTYDAIRDLVAKPPTLAEMLNGVHPDLLEIQTATATALLEQIARGTVRGEVITCTPHEARKINLADNRISDMATDDEDALVELLSYLEGDYEGTGWTEEDVNALIEPPPGEPEDKGELLALAGVTVGDPRHKPENGQVWKLGPHWLVIADLFTEWETWRPLLDGDVTFMPYPTPLVPHAKDIGPLVMVQPIPYLAGHLLDKWQNITGEEPVIMNVSARPVTVKATAGGKFKPDDAPYYFAAGGGLGDVKSYAPPYLLVAVNELPTEASERNLLAPILDTGYPILLDSGIFWLTNEHKRAHGVTMDEALALAPEEIDGFEELYSRYTVLYHRYIDRLWGVIELDQGGAVNKRRTRARLEAEGIAPIPVYHPLNDGWDYFDELACTYDRICYGNIVQASAEARLRLLHTLWERHRAYPDLWVHVLGLTVSEQAYAMPGYESCDSSTWISPLRWPSVKTESAMLHRTAELGPAFAYKVGSEQEGRTWDDGVRMCAEAIRHMNLVWRESAARIADLTGQPTHHDYLPGERPPQPCNPPA